MSDLTFIERNKLEKLLEMRGGYVLSFSNRTFQNFVKESTGKDIYNRSYEETGSSKASRLRAFWTNESNKIVGKLIDDLLLFMQDEKPEVTASKLFEDISQIAQRLQGIKQRSTRSSKTKAEASSIRKEDKGKSLMAESGSSANARNVFVVHGRNSQARTALFRFLRSIGLRPIEWSQAVESTGKTSPYIGEIIDAGFAQAQGFVVLMTPDDEVRLKEELRKEDDPAYESQMTGQARPNVLFEAGMALGRHPNRTVIVELGQLRPFSDIGGRHVVKLGDSTAARQLLAERLRAAGCSVDLKGTDWHTEGDFKVKASLSSARNRSPSTKEASIQTRLRQALNDSRFKWRSIERIATEAGITEQEARDILRADSEVRFSRAKSGKVIVGLRSRVGK